MNYGLKNETNDFLKRIRNAQTLTVKARSKVVQLEKKQNLLALLNFTAYPATVGPKIKFYNETCQRATAANCHPKWNMHSRQMSENVPAFPLKNEKKEFMHDPVQSL